MALFAIKLARSVGRLDFDKAWGELNAYQQSVHIAASIVEPFGEDRADLRMAVQTLSLLQGQSPVEFTTEQCESILGIANYLEQNQPKEKVMTPEETARAAMMTFMRLKG